MFPGSISCCRSESPSQWAVKSDSVASHTNPAFLESSWSDDTRALNTALRVNELSVTTVQTLPTVPWNPQLVKVSQQSFGGLVLHIDIISEISLRDWFCFLHMHVIECFLAYFVTRTRQNRMVVVGGITYVIMTTSPVDWLHLRCSV